MNSKRKIEISRELKNGWLIKVRIFPNMKVQSVGNNFEGIHVHVYPVEKTLVVWEGWEYLLTLNTEASTFINNVHTSWGYLCKLEIILLIVLYSLFFFFSFLFHRFHRICDRRIKLFQIYGSIFTWH